MKRKRFSVEQIVGVLNQAELGVPVAELIRQVGKNIPCLSGHEVSPAASLHLDLRRAAFNAGNHFKPCELLRLNHEKRAEIEAVS